MQIMLLHNLGYNKLGEGDADDVTTHLILPYLTELDVTGNYLTSLESLCGSGASILKITARSNQIKKMAPLTQPFSQLTSLDLARNNIEDLPEEWCKCFPKLISINLHNNFIR